MADPGRTATPGELALDATCSCVHVTEANVACKSCIARVIRAAEAPLRERVRILESLLATAVRYHEYAPGVVHVASCETSVGKPCDCWMPAARAALKEPPGGD